MSNQETGWLIEHPRDPRYGRESWYAGDDGFTIDSLQAVRFARQEDAEREIDRFPISLAKSLRATEHAWVGPTPGVEEMYPMRGQPLREAEQPAHGYPNPLRMIASERSRQILDEGFTRIHDDNHTNGELALAAAVYAIESAGQSSLHLTAERGIALDLDALWLYWPWEHAWWKPTTPLRNLVKAGALIAAEIDRLLRAAGEEGR